MYALNNVYEESNNWWFETLFDIYSWSKDIWVRESYLFYLELFLENPKNPIIVNSSEKPKIRNILYFFW
jgi:hypothetical protein